MPSQKRSSTPASTSSHRCDFGAVERDEARWLIRRALVEDLPGKDVTTDTLFGKEGPGGGRIECHGAFTARAAGIVCGVPVVEDLFEEAASGEVGLRTLVPEGHPVKAGEAFLELRGPPAPILRLERTALNFLGRLCGIATLTRSFMDALAGLPTVLLDTRKTTPAWRNLEKYAVRTGGAKNHRGSLSDGILLKDNHAGVLREVGRGDVGEWVEALRRTSPGMFLEVEVDDRQEFLRALDTGVDAILLDNFSTADLRWAVASRNEAGSGHPLLEASGGMRLEGVREIAETGVDRISVGALTHSARVLDIGLDLIQARRC